MIGNQTLCSRGHLKSAENTFGKNQCKPCHKLAVSEYEKTTECQVYRKQQASSPIRKLYTKEYYLKNKDRFKQWHLKKKYGLSIEEFTALYQKQNGKCAVCDVIGDETLKGLVVDHNHETGEVRGLLCNVCNSHVIHVVETYPHLLEKAKTYLGGSL